MIFKNRYKDKTDEQLVEIALKNNNAVAELYERYVEKIYKFAYYKTTNVEVAQDITSETFLSAIKALNTFRQDSSFKNYLFAICKFKIINYYREKYKTESLNELEIQDTSEILDEIEEKLENEQKRFKEMINNLQDDEKTLLTLRFEQGMKIKDIADQLKLTQSNTKVKISRTVSKLRESYKEI
jgi:RNA polymerase sigma-70 factor, ECF subfamily